MKFTEEKLEQAFIELLGNENFPHHLGNTLSRASDEVLIEDDLRRYLLSKYACKQLTLTEANSILLQLKTLPASDLYESNKTIMRWLSDGFILKREDRNQKNIHVELIDYSGLENQLASDELDTLVSEPKLNYLPDHNIYKFVSQLEIVGAEKRIPDGIIYINGLPLVVFEFKSSIRAEASVFDAFNQLTVRYRRDIAELFKYNAFCVLSDGVNNKAGSLVLFSSIGLFALTLNTRYTHAISRVRDIYQDIKQSSSAETHKLSKELDIMVKRCHILKWSFGLLLCSGISSGLFLLGSIFSRFIGHSIDQALLLFLENNFG